MVELHRKLFYPNSFTEIFIKNHSGKDLNFKAVITTIQLRKQVERQKIFYYLIHRNPLVNIIIN